MDRLPSGAHHEEHPHTLELPGLILRREVADQAADCGGKQKRRAEHDPADNAEHHLAALITDQVNSDKPANSKIPVGIRKGIFPTRSISLPKLRLETIAITPAMAMTGI
mgnify:CR=1 FL=1